MYGDKIAQLRRSRSMTQEQAAQAIGLGRSALSHFETGIREPDIRTLIKIADFFEVTVDYIIRNEEAAHACNKCNCSRTTQTPLFQRSGRFPMGD